MTKEDVLCAIRKIGYVQQIMSADLRLFRGSGQNRLEGCKSDTLLCAIPKCFPVCVSELIAGDGWADRDHFHTFTVGKYEKGQNTAFFGHHMYFCFTGATDGFRQFL